MSELDLLRRIADLEARLARLESAGTPYTTSGSTGAMNVTRINAITDGSGGGFYAGSASDVQLYRSAADMWRTPDSLTVDTNVYSLGGLNVGGATGAGAGEIRAKTTTGAVGVFRTAALVLVNDAAATTIIPVPANGIISIYYYAGGVQPALFFISWNTITAINATAAYAVADTAGKMCVYVSGTTVVIRNRTGADAQPYLMFAYQEI